MPHKTEMDPQGKHGLGGLQPFVVRSLECFDHPTQPIFFLQPNLFSVSIPKRHNTMVLFNVNTFGPLVAPLDAKTAMGAATTPIPAAAVVPAAEVLATKIPATEVPTTEVPTTEVVAAFSAVEATAETNSAAANEGLPDIKAVVKSLFDLSYILDECLNDLPEAEEAFFELYGNFTMPVLNEVQAFDGIYSHLQGFLHFQIDEVDNMVDLVCGCLVSDPGGDQLISEVLEGALPDVSAIGDGGTLLDLVDYCLSNLNSALKSVMSRIRPASTAAPNASPTVALQDTQAAIALVRTCLQQFHGCLLNIREDAAALFQVTSAEEVPSPNLSELTARVQGYFQAQGDLDFEDYQGDLCIFKIAKALALPPALQPSKGGSSLYIFFF
jgi:hypothetical protein